MPICVPDTNVVLHNLNVLEDPRFNNVIFLSTVLSEVQNRNKSVMARVQHMLADQAKAAFVFCNDRHAATSCVQLENESPNDFNDRSIRAAVQWLARHLERSLAPKADIKVCLVSHDAACREALRKEQADDGLKISCLTTAVLRDYLRDIVGRTDDLVDRVQYVVPEGMKEGANTAHMFEEHWGQEALLSGVSSGTLLKGKLRVSETSCFFGEIRGKWPAAGFERLLIPGKRNMNRSIHDDIVAVRVLPPSQWRAPGRNTANVDPPQTMEDALARQFTPCGEVVGILDMARRPFCGSIDVAELEKLGPENNAGSVSVLFQPKNNRIPKIRIQTSNVEALKDKRLCVVIDQWPVTHSYPTGHYTEILGKIGDKDTEATIILMENDVPHYDFSQAVYDCLPKGNWSVEAAEENRRVDLRDLCIVSVDPLGCRDIDDALHYRRLPNGHVEVGVHIADVTHFLHEDTAMDDEAAKRCTSVYLVDRRINMLPQLLTENLCSIVANEDRYSFSILWEFDEHLTMVKEWFGKTIIRSRAALYYGDAQKMIDDATNHSEIAESLKGLMLLSRVFKQAREKEGALFLVSQEFKFKVDNNHIDPTDMVAYQTFEANSMVEEWMLYANAAAARKCFSQFPQWTLLRKHDPPAEQAFDSLNEALKRRLGVMLDGSTSLNLNKSLDRCIDSADSFFNKLIRMLTTRCLRQAQYFSSHQCPEDEFRHFGLAMPIYTHFTSPIRRYADVAVHRQLAAAIGWTTVSENHTKSEKMEEIAANINYRHENAQKAGRDSQNLFTGFFLRKVGLGKQLVEDGYVVKVSDTHLFVLVPKFGQEGKVPRESVPEDKLPKLLDKVTVGITVRQQGDIFRTTLEYALVDVNASSAVRVSDEEVARAVADEEGAAEQADAADPPAAKKLRTEEPKR